MAYEIHVVSKGNRRVHEVLSSNTTNVQALSKVKELGNTDAKNQYLLVSTETIYDTANPPVDVGFF